MFQQDICKSPKLNIFHFFFFTNSSVYEYWNHAVNIEVSFITHFDIYTMICLKSDFILNGKFLQFNSKCLIDLNRIGSQV